MRRQLGGCSLLQQQQRRAGLVPRSAVTRVWASSHTTPRHRGSAPSLVGELVTALALPAEPATGDLQRWTRNLDVLHDVHGSAGRERVLKAVLENPSLLSADLELWHTFLVSGFGLPPDSFAKLAAECPALLTRGDVFTAGCCMLFFKSMGWRNKDIAQRIIGYYPQLLLLDRRRDIDPVVRFLERLDCREENLKLLVWEFPRIFDKDYRRHVRKFQYLGVYGLSLQGAAAAAANMDRGDSGGLDASGGGGGRGGAWRSPVAPEWF